MGMDLVGRYGTVSMRLEGWAEVLDLAETFGWTPRPNVSYYTNDWMRVTKADARAMGNALETAVVSKLLPELEQLNVERGLCLSGSVCNPVDAAYHDLLTTIEVVEEVITLCRCGSFRIG